MDRKLDILLVEDREDDAKLVEDAVRAGGIEFSARRVETREDLLGALQEQPPDVILTDCKLPRFDGRSALKLVREQAPQTPVIVVTGTMVDEVAVELLREGAADYVLKDRLSRLPAAIRRALDEAQVSNRARLLGESLQVSESKFRRLFEAAQDGILILDATTGTIEDVNPFLAQLLGYPERDLLGKELWEIGAFKDIAANREAFIALQKKGYCRYSNLPLATQDGRAIEVEFVSNVYEVEGRQVVQCNIRDISVRRTAERAIEAQLDELRRFQRVTVDRELRMRELKDENERLKEQLAAARKVLP